MDREQANAFFIDSEKSFMKNCDLAKRNIGNDIERIVRVVFDGKIEFEVVNNEMKVVRERPKSLGKDDAMRTIVFRSVDFVDGKVKDQVLHKLVIEHKSITGDVFANEPEDFVLNDVVLWYHTVKKAAKELLRDRLNVPNV